MKELIEILAAFDELCSEGKPSALATLIGVEGSAYRHPGARMLVARDGRTWGGVSGGCLERDVARRARGVMDSGLPLRCRYDTSDDEAITTGTSTGCGGTIELFIQPLDRCHPGPLPFFSRAVRDRAAVTFCTFVGSADRASMQSAGYCMELHPSDLPLAEQADSLAGRLRQQVGERFASQPGDLKSRLIAQPQGDVFLEHLTPPQSLTLFGAGPDAVPLARFAKGLGWHVTVVASRPATGVAERFRFVDAVHITSSDDPVVGVAIEAESAVVVMTHNVARDTAILAGLRGPVRYLGLLGPRHRTRNMMAELPEGRVSGVDAEQFFNPVGLDLGARTPEEIALAIISEIQVVLRDASGRPLRECGSLGAAQK